jgi:nitroreductase
MDALNALDAMKARTSVRRYLPRAIPREILEELVDCGRLAPSGYNKQPWVFVVATDRPLLEGIAAAAEYGRFIAKAGACVAIACSESETMLEDASAAAENIIIAASSLGLGSCWVNSFRKPHSRRIEALLRFPPSHELAVLLSLGYPAEDERRSKKGLAEVLRWNGF